ncbi:MAG: hypothetical protein NTZ46_06785 [Verrucomicrobia bacterium]|nr:hypothetical protein [Verrucomicrobiota bacterium]
MNQIIPAVCALALFSGGVYADGVTCYETTRCYRKVACAREEAYPKPLKVSNRCYDAYREPYRICYPRLCPSPEYVEIGNTQRALAIRQAAIIRQREMVQFEKGLLAASMPITQPSSTGTTIFGETEGAGVFEDGCAPIPPAYSGAPAVSTPRVVLVTPPVVGEAVVPLATAVPDRPGCVYSLSGRKAGYIDVRGFAPGSLVKDPYTGRTFRVP